jgi:GAF domain-containing protein
MPAERGLLILFPGDEPRIFAEATTGGGRVEVTLHQTTVSSAEVPESMLHTVIGTRESVILDDALAQKPFSADDYLLQRRVRSVLCLPLVKQAKLIGALYLENNLTSHVFTTARTAHGAIFPEILLLARLNSSSSLQLCQRLVVACG